MSTEKNGQCAIGPSEFLLFCFSEDKIYILLILGLSYITDLFSGNSSHSDCHSSNIYLFVRGFRSGGGGGREIILYGIPIATRMIPATTVGRAAMRTILMLD